MQGRDEYKWNYWKKKGIWPQSKQEGHRHKWQTNIHPHYKIESDTENYVDPHFEPPDRKWHHDIQSNIGFLKSKFTKTDLTEYVIDKIEGAYTTGMVHDFSKALDYNENWELWEWEELPNSVTIRHLQKWP